MAAPAEESFETMGASETPQSQASTEGPAREETQLTSQTPEQDDSKAKKKKAKRKDNDSDSERSYDSSVVSEIPAHHAISDASSDSGSESEYEQIKRDAVRRLTSRDFFAAYTAKLEKYAKRSRDKRNRVAKSYAFQPPPGAFAPPPPPMSASDNSFETASNLVRGVVDYLRVLEKRIEGVERGKTPWGAPLPPPKPQRDNVYHPDASKDIQLTVKFFNADAYLNHGGAYKFVHSDEPNAPWRAPGALMCDQDARDLVRVMYSPLIASDSPPSYEAILDPSPGEIDIIMIGISSPAVISFFRANATEFPEPRLPPVLRFSKPFRPILRLLDQLRNHVEKMETASLGPSVVEPGPQRSKSPFPSEDSDGQDASAGHPHDDVLALPHFRMFLAFVDKYLAKQISLFNRLRRGETIQEISFENLWMLFDIGDLVFSPARDGQQWEHNRIKSPSRRYAPQAYRVMATSGGMPSTTAYSYFHRQAALNEQTMSVTPRRIRNTYTELYVHCYYIDFDGIKYGLVSEIFTFRPFEQTVEIRNLQAYPVHYVAGLSDRLLERGGVFLDMTKISHMRYEGLTVGRSREEISSPVIVDMRLAYQGGSDDSDRQHIDIPLDTVSNQPRWVWSSGLETANIYYGRACRRPWCFEVPHVYDAYTDFQRSCKDVTENRVNQILEEYETLEQQGKNGQAEFATLLESNDFIRLLPGAVPGFALRNRKWVLLDLNLLKPIKQNNEWENLVLPEGHQEMVQAMVETYTKELGSNKDTIGMDLVSGKGKGCIILLHGVPGVGKTSTAECVASHTKKPLYPITCGDIGYRPEDVESNMEHHFRLAHKWGCVLLLDEADVFLAKRDQRDVQRNGLVSVFLRILEYYSGILFLTTNRVGAIDDAFRSRLHLTLYYPKLDKKQTMKIFRRNFERIAEINAEREANGLTRFVYVHAERKVMDWVRENWKVLRWNGRQIRNTFQTVLALSEFHAKRKGDVQPVLTRKYFKIVAQASSQFDEYLKATHGFDEDRVAKRDYIRASDYTADTSLVYRGQDKDVSDSTTESSTESESDSDGSDEPVKKSKKAKAKKGDKREKKGKEKEKGKKTKSEDSDSSE
ncbi:hypothetical protein QBC47DRAFT_392881 [Echria macrotheca]|uniref:AAA+ ATPase domain-containing protein n=1 Tax=Echria macrotheca TaxID=438768 RepID=A0AAJ0F788_9PEZI|nr:hypothetical protein QBC47DRAFT_392881 [Echria macrotheca]